MGAPGLLQGFIVGLAVTCNGAGETEHDGSAQPLRKRFPGDGATDPTVAVFERMDCCKIEMSQSGSKRRRFELSWAVIERGQKPAHFARHRR